MEVNLMGSTALTRIMERNAAVAALTCRDNFDKPFVASDVLKRIIKLGHESVIEHINLTFIVEGLSRDCLQQLSRHRLISQSVESTRHTTKRHVLDDKWVERTEKVVLPQFRELFRSDIAELREVIKEKPEITDDELKYRLRGYWPTNLVLTCNIRELRHIIKLRTAPAALKEFQELARKLFEAVPDEFKYLLEDCVYKAEDRWDTPKKQLREGE